MMLPIDPASTPLSPIVIGFLGENDVVFTQLEKLLAKNQSLLQLDQRFIDDGTLLTCDAVVGILDGNIGVGSEQIVAWQLAADHDLPRIVLAKNTVAGRADFDEAIALAELVLNEDIAMRYYPIVSEDEEQYIALLDVLTSEILKNGEIPVPADSEHVTLTEDDREELIEFLVHLDPSDEFLAGHLGGMPISLPRLKDLWHSRDLVTVLPIDNQISDDLLRVWFSNVVANWVPLFNLGETTKSVNSENITLGIGVGTGVARVWNATSALPIELHTLEKETLALGNLPQSTVLYFDKRIRRGDTLRPVSTSYFVSDPSI